MAFNQICRAIAKAKHENDTSVFSDLFKNRKELLSDETLYWFYKEPVAWNGNKGMMSIYLKHIGIRLFKYFKFGGSRFINYAINIYKNNNDIFTEILSFTVDYLNNLITTKNKNNLTHDDICPYIYFILQNDQNINLIKYLAEYCNDFDICCYCNNSPLHFAFNEEIAKKLIIEKGTDINKLNEFNETPLLYLIHYHKNLIGTIKYLIFNGANINLYDYNYNTPLHFNRNLEIAKLIIEKMEMLIY